MTDLEVKVKLEQAIDKVIDDNCEDYTVMEYPENISTLMAESAMNVLLAVKSTNEKIEQKD